MHFHGNSLLFCSILALAMYCLLCFVNVLKDNDRRLDSATDEAVLPGFTPGYEIKRTVVDGLPYRYTPPRSTGINLTGTDFIVDPHLIKKLGLPPESYHQLSRDNVRQFVFVTAGDSEHYLESTDCIGSIQKYFPGYEILYYDLGLSAEERKEVSSWCDVKVRDFRFDDYPEHIRNKETKCFKFLIIQEALREFGAVYWVDASFRAKAPIDEFQHYFDQVIQTGGVLLGRNKHSVLTNIGWTDPMMYQFLVSDTLRQRDVGQVESGAMLLYNTEFAFTQVLWWMYLCSLDARCCPPQHDPQQALQFDDQTKLEQQGTFHEHRHDQSAINIIMANLFDYDSKRYAIVKKRHTHIRNAAGDFVVNKCPAA